MNEMEETTKRKQVEAGVPAPLPGHPFAATQRPTISAVFISCNEADVFEPALQSVVGWVDEIVVVDMLSTDGTRELAQRYGARLIDHERLTYADPARNFAYAQAKGDWILSLDPDERIPPLLARELRQLPEKLTDIDIALIQRRQIQFGTPMYSKGAADTPQARFFRQGVIYWPPEVHGAPDLSHLRVYTFPAEKQELYFLHDTWRTAQIALDKIVRYTPKDAAQRHAAGKHFSLSKMVFHILDEFFGRTFEGRAYQDGMAGLLMSLYWTMYYVNVDAQLWELDGRPAAIDKKVRRWGRRVGWLGRLFYRVLRVARGASRG